MIALINAILCKWSQSQASHYRNHSTVFSFQVVPSSMGGNAETASVESHTLCNTYIIFFPHRQIITSSMAAWCRPIPVSHRLYFFVFLCSGHEQICQGFCIIDAARTLNRKCPFYNCFCCIDRILQFFVSAASIESFSFFLSNS